MARKTAASTLLQELRACTICNDLALGPRPIFRVAPSAKLLIVGQAPGRITHHKGIPFDDRSGNRLREWLGVDRQTFYDASKIAILPMGLCFPGTGKGGDLPSRAECAPASQADVSGILQVVELALIIGRYAIDWHMPDYAGHTVTHATQAWTDIWPDKLILPHPSPRNNRWLKSNPWFEDEVIPALHSRVKQIL